MDSMPKRKVIIDCDTGIDDAIALLLAFQYLDVVGITTVGGNVGLASTQRNTRYVAQMAGRMDVPVFAGYDRPMMAPLTTAEHAHGFCGLGTVQVPEVIEKPLEKKHAVDFLIDTFMAEDDITLVTLGPMTNVAHALLREPRLAKRIPEILFMGGSLTNGNATPAAEFNIYVDPEAAKIVMESGIPTRMVGLNYCRQNRVLVEDVERIRKIGNPTADLAAEILSFAAGNVGRDHMCDYGAMMWLAKPESVKKSAKLHVAVETTGALTRGMTVCDYRCYISDDPSIDITHEYVGGMKRGEQPPNCEVALEMDRTVVKDTLFEMLERYSKNE